MRRVLVVVVSVLAVVVSTAGLASAQTKVREDRVGDGPRAADVRKVRVANGADRLVVSAKLGRVVAGRSAVVAGISRDLENGSTDPVLVVDVYPVAGKQFKTRVLLAQADSVEDYTLTRLRCAEDGTEVRRGRGGLVRVAIDRSCIPQLSNRLQTQVIGYDKRTLGYSFSELFLEGAQLRRGDVTVPGDDVPDIEDVLDETSTVTTRRG